MTTGGVIFDLDGVLVDTAKYHYQGWKRLADHLGVPFDEVANEKLKGVSRRESLIAMLGYVPEEPLIEKWCALKNDFYLDFIGRLDRQDLLPGALALLREIHVANGWKQALASASKNAPLILEKLGIDIYFDAVVDGHGFTHSKPHPEVFQKAAAKLGLPSDRLVVIEDALQGVQAAKTAGMLVIGIGDPMVLSGADRVVRDLSEMVLADIEDLLRVPVSL